MAGIPLNTFKTYVKNIQPHGSYFDPNDPIPANRYPPGPGQTGNGNFLVYTAPLGVTSIILYCQIANVSTLDDYTVTVWHYRANQQPVAFTELGKDLDAPIADVLYAIGGKLALETGDALYISGTSPITVPSLDPVYNTTNLKLTLSVLESANQ